MKKCPYCDAQMQSEASRCKACGRFTDKPRNVPWYFKASSLVVGFLCVGPLVLPLLWLNPYFTKKTKIVLTAVIAVISLAMGFLTVKALMSIGKYYDLIFNGIKGGF